MKTFFKHWRISNMVWRRLDYHVQMNHWKAARNLCNRIERIKADRWYIKQTYPFF